MPLGGMGSPQSHAAITVFPPQDYLLVCGSPADVPELLPEPPGALGPELAGLLPALGLVALGLLELGMLLPEVLLGLAEPEPAPEFDATFRRCCIVVRSSLPVWLRFSFA
jgi:hypothetical protein